MAHTYMDDEAFKYLKSVQSEMKEQGTKGATLGDAIRYLKRFRDKYKDTSRTEFAAQSEPAPKYA